MISKRRIGWREAGYLLLAIGINTPISLGVQGWRLVLPTGPWLILYAVGCAIMVYVVYQALDRSPWGRLKNADFQRLRRQVARIERRTFRRRMYWLHRHEQLAARLEATLQDWKPRNPNEDN